MSDLSDRLPSPGDVPGRLLLTLFALLLPACGQDADDTGATVGESIHVLIRDVSGEPIPIAEVFVDQPEESVGEAVGEWRPSTATLTLPPSATAHTITVQARGFQTQRVEGIREDLTLVLKRGILVRLRVDGDTLPSDDPLRLVFRLRPIPAEGESLSAEEAEKLLDLMGLVSPPLPDEPDLPRKTFGFAVADTVAYRGVLLPMPGRYLVRWGLFDERAELWFTLGEEVEVGIGVEDDPRAQTFDVPVQRNELDRTRIGLADRVAEREAE